MGFSVVIDGEVIHDFLLRVMIKALAIMHVRKEGVGFLWDFFP